MTSRAAPGDEKPPSARDALLHTSSAARPVRRTACWARLGGEDYHAFEAPPDPWRTGSGVNAVAA